MTGLTVKVLAIEMKTSVEYLIQLFANIGLIKTSTDIVSQKEKEVFFAYFDKIRGVTLHKLILQRRVRSTLSIPSIGGRNKKVQVEIRKKRVYASPDAASHSTLGASTYRQQFISNKQSDVQDSIHVECDAITNCSVESSNDENNFQQFLPDNIYQESQLINVEQDVKKKSHQKVKINVQRVIETSQRVSKDHSFELSYNLLKKKKNTGLVHSVLDRSSVISRPIYEEKIDNTNNNRRSKLRNRSKFSRSLKSVKCKNNNYMIYESKVEREELRSVGRIVKNSNKRRLLNNNLVQPVLNKPVKFINRNVVIGETITVVELANKMAIKSSQLIKTMMNLGIMATINQVIDQDIAQLVTEEMGHNVILRNENALEELIMKDRDVSNKVSSEFRAPVVTIMGHVDHGKTSLLDYIRSSKIASSEVGGITQHIGAYHVKTGSGMITFLDTPGHSAFTAMRARGSKVTDIVVLVVAADDGVMLQTIEAIHHAKAAKVPIIVAINKIDKLEADSDKIKNDLVKYGIVPEEWGGDNQFINVSAKMGIGIDDLLEAILLQSEILELRTVFDGMASGVVIEAYLDKGRGPVASVIVREGTLKRGDIVLCGFEYGRIRYMKDELGKDVFSAGPSIPVEVFGLSGSPIAGDLMTVVRDEKKAREVAFFRQNKFRETKLSSKKISKLEDIFNINEKHQGISELNIVLKSDVQGSSEAIIGSLKELSTDKLKVKVIYSSIGGITEADVTLAVASNAVLLAFNVKADYSARRVIDAEKIDIRYYSVIYDLINEVKQLLHGLLIPKFRYKVIGSIEVRNIFRFPKCGTIAGCIVTEGTVKRHNKIRVLRKNIVIHEGELGSLRRFKDDVGEVRAGMECGISIKNYADICFGDLVEVLEVLKN
ncbi:translation initiation factor IF-2 [Blochmannia endosymbiont of Colobopsis nipponica]|uniref:translation initiation factor IF-2 n=1 Tax=Blochmannia endosymbiont of Colobopsis nipponica TaxID=2681987 RepID=UPI001784D008|nr:translation initiation factor IF-2 [Blochmannia endosymbiont of Colobopsis nipponica]QOI10754.1 translation initiation factor IF-2 [Blochmannia endosymbiont of Colobopsis nipponica]